MSPDLMSPYVVTSLEVVQEFATSTNRIDILSKWLEHRRHLRASGFSHGFQWLDGSFLENKTPADLDIVTFVYGGPPSFEDAEAALQVFLSSPELFQREEVKAWYRLDFFLIDLLDNPETVVGASRYFFGLFSHQRLTMIWKGLLQVRLEDTGSDEAAAEFLQHASATMQDVPLAPAYGALPLFDTLGGGTQ